MFVVPGAKAKKAKGESREGKDPRHCERARFFFLLLPEKDFLIVSHLIISYCQARKSASPLDLKQNNFQLCSFTILTRPDWCCSAVVYIKYTLSWFYYNTFVRSDAFFDSVDSVNNVTLQLTANLQISV